MTVSQKRRNQVKLRDQFRCVAEGPHCTRFAGLTMQHRRNKGMGGSKLLDGFENLITLCALCNTLLESDADWAQVGRDNGWKLSSWENPERVAVFVSWAGVWRLLDAEGFWAPAAGRNPVELLGPTVRAVLEGAEP